MPQVPWTVYLTNHEGSTKEEIEQEPPWHGGHQHRVGYRNRQDRFPGWTHSGEDELREEELKALEDFKALRKREQRGDLVNFRDIIKHQEDFHLRRPENRSIEWRYVVQDTEDRIRNEENWPANVEKREKERKQKKDQNKSSYGDQHGAQDEHEWIRNQGEKNSHHDAYARSEDCGEAENGEKDKEARKSKHNKLLEKYSPQELALLRSLQHEKDYIQKLKVNDGKRSSPQKHNRTAITIDEADQFSPDNWIPRSSDLIRLTGKHPLNAEAHLSHLFDAGMITPNELHYVRNHSAVPRLLWEYHTIDIEHGRLRLSMDDLKTKFSPINIPIALACDGNRRKELNMIRRSKGFNWGPGAVSCAYWKGALLRDVLLAAGVSRHTSKANDKRLWVNLEGADEPSEGKYATSVPLDYAMDITNDVILAYEMNDVPLPPDHGYPVRVMIPGYVGGRCVKWLHKVWISDTENNSYYHVWDNRVLPSFVTDKDGEFAKTLFKHPDTACNEQNLNSVIVKPAHGERIPVTNTSKGKTYRIQGYAYDGGGHEVQRVEISLDDGKSWLYCIRKFPDAPIRHGKKFWTWLYWHVDVSMVHLLQARSIAVRCFNVFKNTQPEQRNWNIMGMMNNCWYIVKSKVDVVEGADMPCILFEHPVEPGTGEGGWMKPSTENQLAQVKQEAGTPQKQFTRQEIEKHNTEGDCWIVVEGKVYDASSVLSWHPGGKAAILTHAGRVHQETTNEFASVHDDYAYKKLNECAIGVVTAKAMDYIKQSAEDAAKDLAETRNHDNSIALQKHRWTPVTLVDRKDISRDTRTYTFELPKGQPKLGLGTCQHVQLGFHFKDRMLIRSYTPSRPLLPALDCQVNKNNDHTTWHAGENDTQKDRDGSFNLHQHGGLRDGDGTFDLTVKTYFPDENQPGGAMSNILDCIPIGEEVEIRGPTGSIVYNGSGNFTLDGKDRAFKHVSLLLGGSGITPGYALLARILLTEGDNTQIRVLDANKMEADILLRGQLDEFVGKSNGQLKVTYVLSHPSDGWAGKKGHVDAQLIKQSLFEPSKDNVVFLCGPPGMIQKAALPALKDWGYEEDGNMFGF